MRSSRQAGKGLIGFLIALVVVGYAGIALKEILGHRHREREMADHIEKTLASASRANLSEEKVRMQVVKRAKELGIGVSEWDDKNLELTVKGDRWTIRFRWSDDFSVPGFSTVRKYEIERTWTKFSS